MLDNRLCILVCEAFEREVKAAVKAERLDDVVAVVFPAECGPSSGDPEKLLKSSREKYGAVFAITGCCFSDAGKNAKMSRCFDYIAGKTTNDWYAGQGCYVLTPGWLLRWRHYLESWDFDQQTARDFFAETASRLVLLDTGLYGDVGGAMREFAEYIGRPFEVVPVGLEHFRLLLTNAVLKWRLKTAGRNAPAREAEKPASDYAMAFDLLGSLSGARTEAEAVQNMLDLFARIFAPGKLRYHSRANSSVKVPDSLGPVTLPEEGDYTVAVNEDFAWSKGGGGFLLRVGEKENPLGILEVDDLAFPQHREQYLALALVMVRVCAMAILNGRSYQDLAHLNETLTRRSAELEAANSELEAFCYSVSHDLRAPLRSAEGYSVMLLEDYGDKLDEPAKEYLRGISRASQLMGQLIDDLLNLSRLTRQQMRWNMVDMSGLAESIMGDLRKGSPDRDIRVSIAPGLVCRGDAQLMRIVLDNLLRNAWKFTGKVPSPVIEFGATDQHGVRMYYVRDNGAGFDMAYVDKLFKPFQRLHRAEEFEGNGIGLATVQRIVLRHGGQVWAEGKLGGGATFYFILGSNGEANSSV